MNLKIYYGRLVPVPVNKTISTDFIVRDAVKLSGSSIICMRCNQKTDIDVGSLPNNQIYCRQCLNLGRMSSLIKLVSLPEPNLFLKKSYLKWKGKLTDDQTRCSNDIIYSIKHGENRLLWAVTGAGKTEMLFNGIEYGLKTKRRIGLASPRVDVILELYPRIKDAFPSLNIALLHGRNDEPYHYCQFTLCTTHQLLRFYQAFDVLIIDEVDSFPYAMDKGLHFAAQQALKAKGSLIFLTATPDGKLLSDSKQKKLATSYLTRRFHGHPLPLIQVKTGHSFAKMMQKKQLPHVLIDFISNCCGNKQQFLIFIPKIIDLPIIYDLIVKKFKEIKILTVHAADEQRINKVEKMRKKEVDGLITTTILERGVTFPNINVAVLGADDAVFSMAALVQIAGRVGRSPTNPTGTVLFLCHLRNKNIKRAQQQIKFMNKVGFPDE